MSPKDRTAVSTGRLGDVPRWTLVELIASYGQTLCDEPRRCEGLLRDFCGTHRREIHVLVAALKERVAVELLSSTDQLPRELTFGRLVKRLQDNLGLTEPVAVWAVDSWALALGVISADEITDSVAEECADTTPSSLEQTVVPPQGHAEVLVRRRCDGLVKKGRRLLEEAHCDEDDEEQWKSAEEAVTTLTEALQLVPGEPEARKGLDDALTAVADLAAECGERAYLDRRLARAGEFFRRALEIDPGDGRSETRLHDIARKREELINKAREAIDEGHPKSSAHLLEEAREMFPDDSEIEVLSADAHAKVSHVQASIKERIPTLAREKRVCELSRLLDDLESSGVHIGRLDQYKDSVRKRLDSIAPTLQTAGANLRGRDYDQALHSANAVLHVVADHEEALRIRNQANEHLEDARNAIDTIRSAMLAGDWFDAKRLLLSQQKQHGNDTASRKLGSVIDREVERARNHWRLVAMILVGLVFWLLAGKLAVMFSGGIRVFCLELGLGAATAELACGQTAQLVLAVVMFPFWTALLAGRRALLSIGPLVAIVLVEGVLCGLVIWVSGDVERSEGWWDDLLLAVVHGAAAGILLAVLAQRFLHQFIRAGYFAAMISGALVCAAISLCTMLPDSLHPEILSAKLLLAVVFCGLLLVSGVVQRWSRFALVPVAVLLAYGLELGAERGDASSWQPLLPWVGSLLIVGAVLLLSAYAEVWAYVVAVASTLLVELAAAIETVPPVNVLLGVWFAVWGSLALVQGEHLLPNWQLVQRLRLWNATRAADGTVTSPETLSLSDS